MLLHQSPAARRYMGLMGPTMALYVVVLLASIWALTTQALEGALRYAVAVAPALPISATVVLVGRYLAQETDEFLRSVVVQSILWGTALVLIATTIWGFLEETADAPHIPLYWVYPLFCAGMVPAAMVLTRKYQ